MKNEILQGKKILIGITGSIAAYKMLWAIRTLVKAGAEVKTILTDAATDFVTPLSVSTLSNNDVFTNLSDGTTWQNHVELGLWADVFLIAPCTANTLAKMNAGICDNMVLATYLSAKCPVMIAPAMDLDMWAHPSTRRNIAQIKQDGVDIINVGYGPLASGLVGDGRMAEPEEIIAAALTKLSPTFSNIAGKKILITAGPTYESMDPVRFIGNWSSGKMGIAIAEAAYLAGAQVELILGPSIHRPQYSEIAVHPVESASEMYEKCITLWPQSDIGILAAAVADYTPQHYALEKIKKSDSEWALPLRRTTDIAAKLGQLKKKSQRLVGFAMETENEIENAQTKLNKKNFDFIVLNSLKDEGAGFGHDTNKVKFIFKGSEIRSFDLLSKNKVALEIVKELDKIMEHHG